MFMAAEQSNWCLLKVGVAVALSSNQPAVKCASSTASLPFMNDISVARDSTRSMLDSTLSIVELLLKLQSVLKPWCSLIY